MWVKKTGISIWIIYFMFCMIQELEMKLAVFQEQTTAAENVSETFEEKVQAYEQKMKVRFANTDLYLHVL